VIRGLFIAAWSEFNMPLGDTTAQIYALQARVALTERVEIFAAKDGIVWLSPGIGASQNMAMNVRDSVDRLRGIVDAT
jgi:hypothetical protein